MKYFVLFLLLSAHAYAGGSHEKNDINVVNTNDNSNEFSPVVDNTVGDVTLTAPVTIEGSTVNQGSLYNDVNLVDYPVFTGSTSSVTIGERSIALPNLFLKVVE